MENGVRGADHRVMRAGKAEDAMGTTGTARNVRRRLLRVLRVAQTEFEAGNAVMRLRRERETADRNEQSLRRHRIGDDDTDQRTQNACAAKPANTKAHGIKLASPDEAYSTNDQSFDPSNSKRRRPWHFCYSAVLHDHSPITSAL
jgi:hypothetical protein